MKLTNHALPTKLFAFLFLASLVTLTTPGVLHAKKKANYDESKVPSYTLPDPLVAADGQKITSAQAWQEKRREEVLELFRKHVYGRSPGRPERVSYRVKEIDRSAFGGKATRKQVEIQLGQGEKTLTLDLLLYLPNKVKGPVPTFLGLNFFGNHAVSNDPAIPISTSKWFNNRSQYGISKNHATEKSRAARATYWSIDQILDRGFGLATVYYGDIDPDYHDGFKNGAHALFESPDANTKRPGDAWGTISAWAWGLSQIMDYLETDTDIDAKRVVVFGHSRLGKTALWAGAQDQRFAIVISNNSGCTGAALSRRAFGETLAIINHSFPHWGCENYKQYNNNESALPVDQHMLIALAAPRPVYIASATDDLWADPKGEFLAAKNAEPIYRLFGKPGLMVDEMPAPDTSIGQYIGYHLRTGKHKVTDFDWKSYLDFAEKHFSTAK